MRVRTQLSITYNHVVHMYLLNTVNNFASGNLQNVDPWPRGAKDVLFIMAYLYVRRRKQNGQKKV